MRHAVEWVHSQCVVTASIVQSVSGGRPVNRAGTSQGFESEFISLLSAAGLLRRLPRIQKSANPEIVILPPIIPSVRRFAHPFNRTSFCQVRRIYTTVPQVSKPAVSPISKSAEHRELERVGAATPAGLETRDTADLEVCGTTRCRLSRRLGSKSSNGMAHLAPHRRHPLNSCHATHES